MWVFVLLAFAVVMAQIQDVWAQSHGPEHKILEMTVGSDGHALGMSQSVDGRMFLWAYDCASGDFTARCVAKPPVNKAGLIPGSNATLSAWWELTVSECVVRDFVFSPEMHAPLCTNDLLGDYERSGLLSSEGKSTRLLACFPEEGLVLLEQVEVESSKWPKRLHVAEQYVLYDLSAKKVVSSLDRPAGVSAITRRVSPVFGGKRRLVILEEIDLLGGGGHSMALLSLSPFGRLGQVSLPGSVRSIFRGERAKDEVVFCTGSETISFYTASCAAEDGIGSDGAIQIEPFGGVDASPDWFPVVGWRNRATYWITDNPHQLCVQEDGLKGEKHSYPIEPEMNCIAMNAEVSKAVLFGDGPSFQVWDLDTSPIKRIATCTVTGAPATLKKSGMDGTEQGEMPGQARR